MSALAEAIKARASEAAFGSALVMNTLRSMIVEVMLDMALPDDWRWCAADFAGWDFQHADGTRLEVKQSAARQTWAAPPRPRGATFDIRARTGHWDGSTWVPGEGRKAGIYVFAYHPRVDENADHRDPAQWRFYVVATNRLPSSKTVSLTSLRKLAEPVGYDGAAQAVELARRAMSA